MLRLKKHIKSEFFDAADECLSKGSCNYYDKVYLEAKFMNLCYNKTAFPILQKYMEIIEPCYTSFYECFHDLLIEKYPEKIIWNSFCVNARRIDYIRKNFDKINWIRLSQNRHAVQLLKENKHRICWISISENPEAIDLIKDNLDKISWQLLSSNSGAIDILERNKDKIDWKYFTVNKAIWKNGLLLEWIDVDRLDWSILCKNPNSIYLIEQYPERICWGSLSQNPKAIRLLRENTDKIQWRYLSLNYSEEAVQLMKENMDKQDEWNNDLLFSNPYIFEYDYDEIERKCNMYKEELMAACWHPLRVQRYLDMGYDWFLQI